MRSPANEPTANGSACGGFSAQSKPVPTSGRQTNGRCSNGSTGSASSSAFRALKHLMSLSGSQAKPKPGEKHGGQPCAFVYLWHRTTPPRPRWHSACFSCGSVRTFSTNGGRKHATFG